LSASQEKISQLTASKFTRPKRYPDALHRIALESFLIAGRQNDAAMMSIP
jgi:hypothetical protein